MANYDNRLGEWFKQVERSAQELRKKKTDDTQEVQQASFPEVEEQASASRVEITNDSQDVARSRERIESSVATMETSEILVEEKTVDNNRVIPDRRSQALFDDTDVAAVEDFFSFLNHQSEPEIETKDTTVEMEAPKTPLSRLSEGTGEPRPLENNQVINEAQKIEPEVVEAVQPDPMPVIVEQAVPERHAQPANEVVDEKPIQAAREGWDRMPHHLQTLFGVAEEEVAQNSYKTFKESRGELINRLLDPPLTLEEAARILNVCPTTVRRYTNRGVLKHFRTAGNQRRFRLSDVLSFMESNGSQTS